MKDFEEKAKQHQPNLPPSDEQAHAPAAQKTRESRLLGLISFFSALAAALALVAVALVLLLNFQRAEIDNGDIQLAKSAVFSTAGLAVFSSGTAIAAFCLRRQKKGYAVVGLLLSLVLLVGTLGSIYAYNYIFGKMTRDDTFRSLSKEDLYIRQTDDSGGIVLETEPPEITEPTINLELVEFEALGVEDLEGEAAEKMNTPPPINHHYLMEGSEQISNFLLIGLDGRGSSDSVILFSVDRVHHKIKMISLARDSYIRYPYSSTYSKLAYTYNVDGAQTTVAAVNLNFGLNVQDYIAVDMDQLRTIVDYVGGVDVEIDAAEAAYLRSYSSVHVGTCHLSGDAAVAYSRMRSSSADDNEIKRTSRQREVLLSIMNAVMQMPATGYPALIRNCLGLCTTSFNTNELLEIALEVTQNGYAAEEYALIEIVDYWGGLLGKEQYFYCVFDLNRAADAIHRVVYEDLYISGYGNFDTVE